MPYDKAWFLLSLFGARFGVALTDDQYEFAAGIAADELKNVLCWCPTQYPQALSIRIALILEAANFGGDEPAPLAGAVPSHDAFVVEDEVFDVRRKYKLVPASAQRASSSPAEILQGIIDRCRRPLAIGAFLARGAQLMNCGCVGDKAEFTRGD